jgi:hypothetical protein
MTRGWQDYWHWKDKPVHERASARTVLEAAGVKIDELRSRNHDPPDCEAFLDGQWSGIEVTELLDQPTLEQSIRARRERDAGKIPERSYGSATTLSQPFNVDEKDIAHKVKGGPYQRYVLVILTAETFLAREYIQEFLKDAEFRARLITDAFLGLDYHPANPLTGEDGGNPAALSDAALIECFPISAVRRSCIPDTSSLTVCKVAGDPDGSDRLGTRRTPSHARGGAEQLSTGEQGAGLCTNRRRL